MIPPAPRARPSWAAPAAIPYVLAAIAVLAAVGMTFGVLDGLAKRGVLDAPPIGRARITGTTLQYGRYGSSGRLYWQREGDSAEHRCNVSLQRLRLVAKGEVVDVRGYSFLGQARELPEPCAQYEANTATRQAGLLGAGVLVALGGGLYLLRWAARKNRVYRDGAAAKGRVRSVQRIGAGGKARYRLVYTFGAATGEAEGKLSLAPRRARQIFGDAGPREGDAIDVVYDPANPRNNELWGVAGERG